MAYKLLFSFLCLEVSYYMTASADRRMAVPLGYLRIYLT